MGSYWQIGSGDGQSLQIGRFAIVSIPGNSVLFQGGNNLFLIFKIILLDQKASETFLQKLETLVMVYCNNKVLKITCF